MSSANPTLKPGVAGVFPGTASDANPAVLATGRGDVATTFFSMSGRSADGRDAEYIQWHILDHLPEQYRLPGLRCGQRVVSTPECRAARAAEVEPFDKIDHIVQYMFAEPVDSNLDAFFELGRALRVNGRHEIELPRVRSAAYDLAARRVNSGVTAGADVLPWLPALGMYVIVEAVPEAAIAAHASNEALRPIADVEGVTGAWRYRGRRYRHSRIADTTGQAITVCYLGQPPLAVAPRLAEALKKQWASGPAKPLFAGPFYFVVPFEWNRYLPV